MGWGRLFYGVLFYEKRRKGVGLGFRDWIGLFIGIY